FANWYGSYIVISHQFCELSHRGVRADPIDAFVHRVFDFHGGPPLLELERNATSPLHPALDYTSTSSLFPRESMFVARNGHVELATECPLSGLKQTSRRLAAMSVYYPKGH